MGIERRGEQSVSFSRVSIAEKTTSAVTNRVRIRLEQGAKWILLNLAVF